MADNLLKQQFKQTEIGEIPQVWEVKRLGDIADTSSGGTPSRAKKEYFFGNVPWVKSGELEDGVIDERKKKFLKTLCIIPRQRNFQKEHY